MSTFMQNATEYGAFYVGETTEGTTILHPDVFHTEKEHYKLLRGERWRRQRGWFVRLSAPGFLDCTEWSGPYDSQREANEALSDMFDGDPIEDDHEGDIE